MDLITQTSIYFRLALSPIIILLGIFVVISSFRLRKAYKIDKIICISVFLAGIFILVYGVSSFVLSPYLNLSLV